MEKLKSISKKAKNNLNFEEYRERVNDVEDKIHSLRDDLYEAEKSALQEENYKPIKIDDHTIMAPVGMSVQQFYVSIQNMPVPDDNQEIVRYFVTEEDIKKARKSEDYKSIVNKRETKIEEIYEIYSDFWKKEVKDQVGTDEEAVVYMLVGIGKDIRSKKINKITGVPIQTCQNYELGKNNIVKKH